MQGDIEQQYKGAAKHVSVVLEDRAGGRKHITRITGKGIMPSICEEICEVSEFRF